MNLKKVLLIVSSACLLAACSLGGVWSSPPIRGQIVSLDGVPIKNAVVVGTWEAQKEFHHASLSYFEIQEAVTDENGWFTLPGFPMRYVRETVSGTEPYLMVVHRDFIPVLRANSFGRDLGQAPSVMKYSLPDGQIKLAPFDPTSYRLHSALSSISIKIGFDYMIFPARDPRVCPWEKMSKLLIELEKIRLKLEKVERPVGQVFSISPIEDRISWANTKCGDAEKILKELGKDN